jgi:hypothetical protein
MHADHRSNVQRFSASCGLVTTPSDESTLAAPCAAAAYRNEHSAILPAHVQKWPKVAVPSRHDPEVERRPPGKRRPSSSGRLKHDLQPADGNLSRTLSELLRLGRPAPLLVNAPRFKHALDVAYGLGASPQQLRPHAMALERACRAQKAHALEGVRKLAKASPLTVEFSRLDQALAHARAKGCSEDDLELYAAPLEHAKAVRLRHDALEATRKLATHPPRSLPIKALTSALQKAQQLGCTEGELASIRTALGQAKQVQGGIANQERLLAVVHRLAHPPNTDTDAKSLSKAIDAAVNAGVGERHLVSARRRVSATLASRQKAVQAKPELQTEAAPGRAEVRRPTETALDFDAELKRRLQRALGTQEVWHGHRIEIALLWSSRKDLDLQVTPPSGRMLKPNGRAHSGGQLVVDMNCGDPTSNEPVEYVVFQAPSNGKYEIATSMPQAEHWCCAVTVHGQRRVFKGYGEAAICTFHYQDGDSLFSPSGYAVGPPRSVTCLLV